MALTPRMLNHFGFPTGFDDFFANDPFFHTGDIIRFPTSNNSNLVNSGNQQWRSPGYHVHQDDKTYTLSIDVPGVKAADMKTELEDDGRVLHLSGARKIQTNEGTSETKFDHRFTLSEKINTDKLSANLEHGVLTLTAPKKEVKKNKGRLISITEKGE